LFDTLMSARRIAIRFGRGDETTGETADIRAPADRIRVRLTVRSEFRGGMRIRNRVEC